MIQFYSEQAQYNWPQGVFIKYVKGQTVNPFLKGEENLQA